MHADKQPFPLQIADVGYCRYFLRTRQLNSPFASIRPSVVRCVLWETERKLCLKQLPEWTERDTPLPNPSVNKFDICPHFAPGGGREVLEKVDLSERRFMECCMSEGGTKS